MNKNTLKRQLDAINAKYPKEQSSFSDKATAEQKNNACAHRNELYELTCLVDDLYGKNLISKSAAVDYGRLIKSCEYYDGEAGLGHFAVFNSIEAPWLYGMMGRV